MTALRLSLLVLLMGFFAQGCSVYTAFTHPPKVDIEGLENMKGVDRSYIMSQCGVPQASEKTQERLLKRPKREAIKTSISFMRVPHGPRDGAFSICSLIFLQSPYGKLLPGRQNSRPEAIN